MIVYGAKVLDTPTIIKAMQDKEKQNVRIKKLQDYYNGLHEICYRHYDDPTKPNNRIVVNYCKDIADFLTAYVCGVPVEYNATGKIADTLAYNDDAAEMQSVLRDMVVCGFAVELFYTDENGDVRYNNIDPMESIVFMNDDLQGDIVGFVRMVKRDKELGGYNVTVYTATTVQDFIADDALGKLTATTEQSEHHFGDVPVVMYPNGDNMQGNFEQIIPLQDALNKVVSDSVNDWESFVDSYLVLEGMQGTTPEDIAQMKKDRVLLTDPDSKAYWLTKQADNARIKTMQDDLRRMILELGNIPDMQELSGLNTSGEAMRMKLTKTEIQASRLERIMTKGIQRKIELLYNILRLSDDHMEYMEVMPKFTRNFLINDVDTVLQSAEYLDEEYITTKILTMLGDSDKVQEVLRRKDAEAAARYTATE